MAGGTYSTYNKVRPGAYINFQAAQKNTMGIGERGIVTLPMVLPWGSESNIITVTSEELATGKSLQKIGLTVTDDAAQPLREALKNAYKALVGRVNKGGTKATAKLATDVTAVAAHIGTLGNNISVIVQAKDGKFNVLTVVNGKQYDSQTISTVAEFTANSWIELTGSGTLEATAGVTLAGGADGTTSDNNYGDYMTAVSTLQWNTMAIHSESATLPQVVASYIKDLRENRGKKVQAVVYNYDADYEGIINSICGYKTDTETISPATFTAYVAGVTAGATVDQSNTYHVIPNATEIVNPLINEEIEEALGKGKLVLSRRQDNVIVIEKDINSLHTYGENKSYVFTKNRIIRTLDDIATQTMTIWEIKYIGKVSNNDSGRNMFKGELISFLNTLQSIGAIQNFDSTTDIDIAEGSDKESVNVELAVEPADAAEKLYLNVTVS